MRRPRRTAFFAVAFTALLALGACDGLLPGRDKVDPTRVMQRLVVAERSHSAFPHAVRLRSGEVLVSWREGAGHMYTPARLMFARYRDAEGGLELMESGVMFDRPGEDEREGGLVELADGTLLANLFTGHYVDGGTYITEFWYPLVLRSSDGGRTWSDTVPIPAQSLRTADGRRFDWVALRAAVVETSPGELLMPVYALLTGDTHQSNHVLRSSDGGRTWRYGSQIARDGRQRLHYNETSLLVDGARVVAVYRSEDGYLRQSESTDGGDSWSPPRKLDLWGVPPHLLRLADGTVLMARGYRRGAKGVRYTLSRDGGRTWERNVDGVLLDDATSKDCGYPSTVQLADGSLLTVYYLSVRGTGDAADVEVHAVRFRVVEEPAR